MPTDPRSADPCTVQGERNPVANPADVELVARAICDLTWGTDDDHAPWHYTEFGVICACGAAMTDERCTANWADMTDEDKENYREPARAALSALAAAGRLLPPDTETRTEWGIWWPEPRPVHQSSGITGDYGTEEKAREFATAYGPPFGEVLHRTIAVTPWQPVPNPTEDTEGDD